MSRTTTRARPGRDRASLYTEITDKIIAELYAEVVRWSFGADGRVPRRAQRRVMPFF